MWQVIQQPAVGEGVATTDGVVAGSAESVVDVQTYHHSAVAAAHRAMGVDNHRVAQSGI